MKQAWKRWLIMTGSILFLSACGQDEREVGVLRIGVVEGPEVKIINVAKRVAEKKYGLEIKTIVFENYSVINRAVCEGEIDANIFQPMPYLKEQIQSDAGLRQVIQAHRCQLVPIASTFVYSMGLFSRTLTSLSQVPQQGVVAIPSEPISSSRALLLLQKAGLIRLRPGATVYATTDDIVSNPRQLVFVSILADRLPEVVAGAALVAVNPNYMSLAGLSIQNALAVDASPEYAVLIVTRKERAQDSRFAQLVAAYHSAEVYREAELVSGNSAFPAWRNSGSGPANSLISDLSSTEEGSETSE